MRSPIEEPLNNDDYLKKIQLQTIEENNDNEVVINKWQVKFRDFDISDIHRTVSDRTYEILRKEDIKTVMETIDEILKGDKDRKYRTEMREENGKYRFKISLV